MTKSVGELLVVLVLYDENAIFLKGYPFVLYDIVVLIQKKASVVDDSCTAKYYPRGRLAFGKKYA